MCPNKGLTDGDSLIPTPYINPAAFWSLLLALINQLPDSITRLRIRSTQGVEYAAIKE